MSDDGRLFGIKAVVFGAASGIGEAIARVYSKHGARVVAADEPESGIDRQLTSVTGVIGLPLALADTHSAATAINTAVRDLGGLDIVVNSFALQPDTPFDDEAELTDKLNARLERIRRHFDMALPQLKSSPSGRMISIGYVRSAFARNADALVELAEDALAMQTSELAEAGGQDGITVNYIQPGAVMTADSRRIFTADKAFRDICIRGSSANRLGDPIDIAKVALFLASDDSAFVSGTGIRVDGGRRADSG